MKIAYIIPKLVNKGPIIVVQELVQQMIIHGHECYVYFFDEGQEISLPCKTQKISFFESIDFNKFDIIHTHGLRPDLYVFIHKPHKCKSKCITTLHNYIIPDLSYQYNKLIAYSIGNIWISILRRHDKVVTLSKDAIEYYSKRIPLNKLTFVYNTRSISTNINLPEEDTSQLLTFKDKDTLIGVNAALTARKGIDQVIKALKFLPKYKLVIIGNGKAKDDLESLAKKEKVDNRVLFLGYKKDAYRFLPFYDIFALPSRSEGFGLTLIESAIFKKNVICSNIEIFKELAPKEVYFFQLENIESLVDCITQISKTNLGEKLYERYLSTFSPNIFYQKYHLIYTSL